MMMMPGQMNMMRPVMMGPDGQPMQMSIPQNMSGPMMMGPGPMNFSNEQVNITSPSADGITIGDDIAINEEETKKAEKKKKKDEEDESVTCDKCSKEYKISQVLPSGTDVLQGCPFLCPFCRLLHVDPWHQTVRILARNTKIHREAKGTIMFDIELEKGVLTKKHQVEVRCVSMAHVSFFDNFL